jgi:general secretion pathway protein M
MAQLLPDKEKQRPLAYMLLVISLILVYWVGFHWFFQAQAERGEEMDLLLSRESSLNARIAMRPELEVALGRVSQAEQGNDYFLKQTNTSLASSELTTMLKQAIALQAQDEQLCQVSSNQNIRVREQERFQRVTIKVRMRCELNDLYKVFHLLEDGTPYTFVDNVSVYRQVSRRTSRNRNVQPRILDVRFDLSGYIQSPGVAP